MKLKAILSIALFVLSLTVTGFIVVRVSNVQNSQGFTLHINITDYPADGSAPILSATVVRHHKADGSWKSETTYQNGRVDVAFGQMDRGVFRVDEKNKQLVYLSGLSPNHAIEQRLRNSPDFVGEEMILGYKVLHTHQVSQETGEVLDSYSCPALQGFPIKVVSTFKNGAKHVMEATRVTLGEPSFDVPNYPVDTKHYEAVHGKKP